MSLLKNVTVDDAIQPETDSLGGGGAIDTGLYLSTIEMAYVAKSKGGALGLFLTLKTGDGSNSNTVKQTLWITSGDSKGNKNYYESPEGDKRHLPGFLVANSLALLTKGINLAEMDTEEKVVKVYNYEAKKEMPTKVEVVMDLLDQTVIAAIMKQTVDKRQKNDNTGAYEATGETRDENEIVKIFREKDSMTVTEILARSDKAVFMDQWKEKWSGKTRDRTKGGSNNNTGASSSGTGKPTSSLFGS